MPDNEEIKVEELELETLEVETLYVEENLKAEVDEIAAFTPEQIESRYQAFLAKGKRGGK